MGEKQRKLKDKASSSYRAGKLKDALKLYKRVVKEDPTELGTFLKIGDIHRKLGQKEEAIAAYEPVARHYAEDGLILKAIAVCKLVLVIRPDHPVRDMLETLHSRRRVTGGLSQAAASPKEVPIVAGTPVSDGAVAKGASALPAGVSWPVSVPAERPTSAFSVEPGQVLRVEASDTSPSDPGVGTEDEPIELVVKKPDLSAPIELTRSKSQASRNHSLDALAQPHIPLFSDLSKDAFVELLVRMSMLEFAPGEQVIREGENGDSFFVLVSGRVRVSRRGDGGQEVILAYLTDGAFFGEMALLQAGPRTASVTAEEDCQVFELKRAVLDNVVAQYPRVAGVLDNFYKQRLLSTAMAVHPIFTPFRTSERRALMELFKSRHFEAGSVLLQQGAEGSGLFIVLSGNAVVTRTQNGDVMQMGTLSPGDIFGEMSLLTNRPIFATVTAQSDCFVLRLGKKRFDEVIMTHPQVLELVSELSDARESINLARGVSSIPPQAILV